MSDLKTAIVAVSVYPDRARVTRQGATQLEPGLHRLAVTELPPSLNNESLRAAARGTARARLLSVQAQRTFYAEAQVEQVRSLEEQLEKLQDEQRGHDAHLERIRAARGNLIALTGHSEMYATALAAGELSVDAHLSLLDSLNARLAQLDGELLEVETLKRELERQIQKVKNELNRWRGAPRRERYTAWVEVEVLSAGELTVDLTYVISGAGWLPLYDLRLQEEDGRAVLEAGYLAQVTQNSGEAWEDVSLTLSTARPALAGRLPELDPWYVMPQPPPRPAPQVEFAMAASPPAPAMRSRMAKVSDETTGAVPEMLAAEVITAAVDSSGAAVTYHLPGKVSVPADGAPHKVTVAQLSLEPRLDYVCAPKLVAAVYRRAKVENKSAYTLLPGPGNLFANDEFIGAIRVELVAPQGELELYFGADDRIKVERELKRREVDKRLISGKRRVAFGYEIRLENLLPGPAKIKLQDHLPVSRHEDIKVRLEGADPKASEQTELNLLNWELTLAPKEKRTVRFDFSVESPQAMELIGLD